MVRGSSEQRQYLDDRRDAPIKKDTAKPPCATLPAGYTPFRLSGDRAEAPYLSYLRSRNITERIVALYRMGYVADGELSGRVVIPSFDRFGSINFWSARSIYPGEHLFRYRLPPASKDVISNEHMVDWNTPVYIVEGIFDEIAAGSQGIAVYGKFVPPSLTLRLVEKRPPMTYICLDDDARDDAMDLLERLAGYDIPCAVVDLGCHDPAIAGFDAIESAAMISAPHTGSIGILRERLRYL